MRRDCFPVCQLRREPLHTHTHTHTHTPRPLKCVADRRIEQWKDSPFMLESSPSRQLSGPTHKPCYALWEHGQIVKRHSRSCPCRCCHTSSTESQRGTSCTSERETYEARESPLWIGATVSGTREGLSSSLDSVLVDQSFGSRLKDRQLCALLYR